MTERLGLTDHPIERVEQDLLGRSGYAALLADEIRSIDATHGAVVGVLGPWGYGKTGPDPVRAEQREREWKQGRVKAPSEGADVGGRSPVGGWRARLPEVRWVAVQGEAQQGTKGCRGRVSAGDVRSFGIRDAEADPRQVRDMRD